MPDLIMTPSRRLGWVAQPDSCERCFKVLQRLNWKGPWNTFPSDYSRFDAAQQNHIQGHIAAYGKPPAWLSELGPIIGFIEPPHFHSFFFTNEECGVKIRGTADLILRRADGKLVVVDLKSAPPKGDQDAFAATYMVQVCSYARAAEERGLGTVADLAIVYLNAQYDAETMARQENSRSDGLAIPFQSTVHRVTRDDKALDALCRRFRELYDMTTWPEPEGDCNHCQLAGTIHQTFCDAEKGYVQAASSLREMYVRYFGCE